MMMRNVFAVKKERDLIRLKEQICLKAKGFSTAPSCTKAEESYSDSMYCPS
jgi:hypothetical protein